jgi:hypothetical protein
MSKKKEAHDNLYYMARKLATKAMSEYDPFVRVRVNGPFEGSVVFSDGTIYKFSNGQAEIHRKNLPEAYSLGCRKARKGA